MAERKPRFAPAALRMLKEATLDDGYVLYRSSDRSMLFAFLERFDQLGWFPPTDLEKRRLLASHDVIMHVVRDDLCFHEFRSKGARGERQPWLTIFFHVDAGRTVRLCGFEASSFVERHRGVVTERIRMRVEVLGRALDRRKET